MNLGRNLCVYIKYCHSQHKWWVKSEKPRPVVPAEFNPTTFVLDRVVLLLVYYYYQSTLALCIPYYNMLCWYTPPSLFVFIAHAIVYRINIYNLPADKVTLGYSLVQSLLQCMYDVRIIINTYVSTIKVCQNRARKRDIISPTNNENNII